MAENIKHSCLKGTVTRNTTKQDITRFIIT